MVYLADGLALRRLAERCADRGAAIEIADSSATWIAAVTSNDEVRDLVAHIFDGDGDRATQWLDAIAKASASPLEEDGSLVTALAALGNVIIEHASTQPTGSFDALVVA
jgi:hypothetical protein